MTLLRELQDALGAAHDLDVWINWIPRFIIEERRRIRAYFGNSRPLKRLLPGLETFLVAQKDKRGRAYTDFIVLWEKIERDNTWETLKKVIGSHVNQDGMIPPDGPEKLEDHA